MNVRVLLVDDEDEFVTTLAERLNARGLLTEVAGDGQEAIARFAAERFDVVVTDLKMPGMNGFELMLELKASSPHTPVIILTGHGSDKDRAYAEEHGATAYFQKPVDIAALKRAILEAAPQQAPQNGAGS